MWGTEYSCGVDMGDQYVVIGGTDNKATGAQRLLRAYLKKVGLYNDDGFVRNLPDLPMGRYDHACAGFKDKNGDMVSVIFL